jgi:hypothetical protein
LDRKTGPRQKDARKDDCGGQPAQKSAAGQQARADSQPGAANAKQLAAIDTVGQRASRQPEQKER